MEYELSVLRHSLQHVMVLAVRRIFGAHVQLGVGPVIDDGFYQDFAEPIGPEVFPRIQDEMRKIISEDLPIARAEVEWQEARDFFAAESQAYKVALLDDIMQHGTSLVSKDASAERVEVQDLTQSGKVSLYSIGIHRDLCRGPHVARTSELGAMAFQLDRVAGAYWRGDEKQPMLCRLYALAFAEEGALKEHLDRRDEAALRDHRKLGEQLGLFMFHESAPGMPYWLPKGMKVRNALIQYWRQYHEERGYQEIQSPVLNKRELWEISGHWAHYHEDMVCASLHGAEWALKPMNCCNAMVVYKSRIRSYRELPLRLSDIDLLHRNERPGSLLGLMRTRCFQQDDSHNFVAESQIKEEIERILAIVRDFYAVFALADKVKLYLSTRPDAYMGDAATWQRAEEELHALLIGSGFKFGVKPKDGAFYGPKIDIHLEDCLGREWQCGTIQLDFQLPRNFGLEYVGEDGARHTPVVIHRVIYGSLERFIGILIEHFAGRFPFWIAPEQVRVLTVGPAMEEYAAQVIVVLRSTILEQPLRHNELRWSCDSSPENLGKKIRLAEVDKVPVVLVLGKREAAEKMVALRYAGESRKLSLAELPRFLAEIR